MRVGYLYIMQYPDVTYFKVGRSFDVKKRVQQTNRGTKLHLSILTSDMRAAEEAMLSSLRSAEAVAEGVEAVPERGTETFRGPFHKIAHRVTAAARLFPAAPHNLMSPEAAREWYEREKGSGALSSNGKSIKQFLIDNECLTNPSDFGTERRAIKRARPDCPPTKLTGCPEDLQLAHEHVMAVDRYAVDEQMCDAEFFDKYVKTYLERDEMVKQFYALQRFHHVLKDSPAPLEAKYDNKLSSSQMDFFYMPALSASALLDKLAPDWRALVQNRESVEVRIGDCPSAVSAWVSGLSDSGYGQLIKLLGIVKKNEGRDAGSTRQMLYNAVNAVNADARGMQTHGKNPTKTASQMVERLLQATFGVTLGKRSGRDPRCTIDTSAYHELVEKYKCGCFTNNAFVDWNTKAMLDD